MPLFLRSGRLAVLAAIAIAAAAFLLLGPTTHAAETTSSISFGRDILPILGGNCFQCHGPDEHARKAKLRLDRREGALKVVTPGKSEASELIRRINAEPEDGLMPPRKSNRRLSAREKELLRRWIEEGAVWSKHWAYESPHRPALPAVRNTAWPRNAIDRFVLARLEKEGLQPAAVAAKETLIRRLTLDLIGLPPTVEEVRDFLADTSPTAYEKVVDRLLASPRYRERMALDWLDDARFADTNGYQNDFARTMWPWRDWVINAFNRNMPFDQFTIEQLAGDLLPGATLEQKIATGFNRNNRTVTEAGSIDEEWRIENAIDRVETTATVFLGLTMGCGRCHDHKFDPISQKEMYQFLAFFNSVNEKGVYTEQRGNVPPLLALPTPEEKERLAELETALAAAEKDLREREAAHKKQGSGAEKKQPSGPAKVSPTATEAAVQAAKKKVDQLRKQKTELEQRIPTVMVMEDLKTPRETYVLKRGQYDQPDKKQKVEPGVPAVLPPLPSGAPRSRLGLARWLVSRDNPLTARVVVNRYWQHSLGVGLVKTAENFGVQGEPPSHPELLDWLATEFVESGWNVKRMQRLIVTSAAYRQSSAAAAELVQQDPENRLLARGPRFRLPAEVVRDNALAISGLLTEKLGGPSIKPYQPSGLWEELAGGAGEGPYVQDHGRGLYRRSLYVYRKRTVPHPALATFDAPSREVCQVKRARTDTPLQALELLNDVTHVEAARALAQRMLREGGPTAEQRLSFAFQHATARLPDVAELHILSKGLERQRQTFMRERERALQLVRHGESPLDSQLDVAELAAYTVMAGVILNLDETISQE